MFDDIANNPVLKHAYETFLTIFGDIKVFKFPFFIVYDPGAYKVRGDDLRRIQNTLEPGDILLRYYDNYLDGMFIPGKFSHAGLYVGENDVVHAIAEGVVRHDILDFCRCDGVAALRPSKVSPGERLEACAYAVRQIGKAYDFFFNFHSEETFCCSELVYWAYKGDLPLEPHEVTRMMGLLRGVVVLPEDFLTCPDLDLVFMSVDAAKRGMAAKRASSVRPRAA